MDAHFPLDRYCVWLELSVLGIAHPLSHVRDVALFVPFRFALGSPESIVRFPTMMWQLMRRGYVSSSVALMFHSEPY